MTIDTPLKIYVDITYGYTGAQMSSLEGFNGTCTRPVNNYVDANTLVDKLKALGHKNVEIVDITKS